MKTTICSKAYHDRTRTQMGLGTTYLSKPGWTSPELPKENKSYQKIAVRCYPWQRYVAHYADNGCAKHLGSLTWGTA